jgi:hypothetical protein
MARGGGGAPMVAGLAAHAGSNELCVITISVLRRRTRRISLRNPLSKNKKSFRYGPLLFQLNQLGQTARYGSI